VVDAIQSFILAIGCAIGAFLAWCKLCETFEKIIRKEKLQRVVVGVMEVSFRVGARKILALWLHMNNAVFGSKIFSWRALWVSFLLTNIWAAIFILVFSFKYSLFREWMLNIVELSSLRWPALAIYCTILIVEFLSISLTRKIYRVTLSDGKKTFGWALIFDVVGSVVLYYVGLTVAKFILLHHGAASPVTSLGVWLDPNNLTTLLRVVEDFDMSNFRADGQGRFITDVPLSTEVVYAFPEGVFFFTSLLTSIWLWGYIAAYSVAYMCVRIDRFKPVLWGWVRIEEQPLLVLSVLSGLVIVVIYLLVSVVGVVFRL
jgi:hypothetical protein